MTDKGLDSFTTTLATSLRREAHPRHCPLEASATTEELCGVPHPSWETEGQTTDWYGPALIDRKPLAAARGHRRHPAKGRHLEEYRARRLDAGLIGAAGRRALRDHRYGTLRRWRRCSAHRGGRPAHRDPRAGVARDELLTKIADAEANAKAKSAVKTG